MTLLNILELKLYKRDLLKQLIPWLSTDHVLLITGSRQVGKTSLLYLLIQHLVKSGTEKQYIYYLDLEDFDLLGICNEGPQSLKQYLAANGADLENNIYLFIDEIQYLDNPSNFLKLLHDHNKNIKIFCSGSSTLDIKRKFKDSLAGRKIIFELFSLSFKEFLIFNQQESLVDFIKQYKIENILNNNRLETPINIIMNDIRQYFNEYIQFGGYPAITKIQIHDMKITLLNELYQTYIRKDINQLFSIENISVFNNLVRLLALQIGQLVNLKEIAGNISTSRQTIQNYIFVLENTFILKMLQPFFTNKRKELIKMPKIFFHDLGMRNQVVKNTKQLTLRSDIGSMIENFVFQQLNHNLTVNQELKFWRTQNMNEVDFIIESDHLLPIEVKFKSFNSPLIPQGIRFFIQRYECRNALVITKDYFNRINKDGCNIIFLPVMLL